MVVLEKESSLEEALSGFEGIGKQLHHVDNATHGSPLILILTSSAASANDIAKKLANLNKVRSYLCRSGLITCLM